MRDRLMALLVGVTIAVIALYGVPRAYFLADLVQQQQQREVERTVDVIARALSVQVDNQVGVTRSFLTGVIDEGDSLRYVDGDGSSTDVGDDSSPQASDVVRSAPVAGGGEVTLTRSGDMVTERIADAIMPLVLIGLGLLVVSAVAGLFLARRLARPFQELADVATSLGQGRFDREVPHYAIPEVEAVADALRKSSTQLDRLLEREREFAVNASHELLTPITALNLQLEDVVAMSATPPVVREELQASLETLERLGSTVQGLLAHDRSTRRASSSIDLDLGALAAHVVERWQTRVADLDREIRLAPSAVIPARLSPDDVTQILDALLDNACRHGEGAIDVDCAELDTHLRVRVADSGESQVQSNVLHRHGTPTVTGPAGLERAAELAEAQGGYLVRDDSSTTRFVLMLPKPPT